MSATVFTARTVTSIMAVLLFSLCSLSGAQEGGPASQKVEKGMEQQPPSAASATSGSGESEVSDRLRLHGADGVPTGRLPRYFAAVVDQLQRFRIYEIQATYRVKIDKLEQQLEELRIAQMKEIEQILTKDQLQRIEEMRSRSRGELANSSQRENAR